MESYQKTLDFNLAAGLVCGAAVGLYTYFFIDPVYEAKVSMYVYNQEREIRRNHLGN
jgi:capsular polysaccharide biosynthesis protein